MINNNKRFTVYMHICPNYKKYIGITCQKPKTRWNHGKGYKGCPRFRCAIKKYKWENIDHVIIAEGLTEKEACDAEIYWIKYWGTTNKKNGYNYSNGGDTPSTGKKASFKTRIKKGTPIYQFNKKGKFIKEFISCGYAGEVLKMDPSAIGIACKRLKPLAYNYVWRYKDDPIFNGDKISIEKVKKDLTKNIGRDRKFNAVYQFDTDGSFIAEYKNIVSARRYLGIASDHIRRACKQKHTTDHGYLWRYKNDEDFKTYTPNSEEYKKIVYSEYIKNWCVKGKI